MKPIQKIMYGAILQNIEKTIGGNYLNLIDIEKNDIEIIEEASKIALSQDAVEAKWDGARPLESIYNLLSYKQGEELYGYELDNLSKIPIAKPISKIQIEKEAYIKRKQEIDELLTNYQYEENTPDNLLEKIEKLCSDIPIKTDTNFCDISLYAHIKLTIAISLCLYILINENRNLKDIKRDEKAYLLVSIELSGIQKFIYTISQTGAAKMLKSRSYYIDHQLKEKITKPILQQLELSNSNIIYIGGGHCYLLLPNTKRVRAVLKESRAENLEYLLRNFKADLYLVLSYEEISANNLMGNKDENITNIFTKLSQINTKRKLQRYSKEQLKRLLNVQELENENIECSICGSSNGIISEEKKICKTCNYIYKLGETLKEISSPKDYDECALKSIGTKRLGVLRADVDNLGRIFKTSFIKENENLVTLSRYSMLSKSLSDFFQKYIKYIVSNEGMQKNEYTLSDKTEKGNVDIIYSGGDDIFLIGAWDEIIEVAMNLDTLLKKYTCQKVTISAGIGIFDPKYPISVIAKLVGEMEDLAKKQDGKNSVTMLEAKKQNTFYFEELKTGVLAKYKLIERCFKEIDIMSNSILNELHEVFSNAVEKNESVNKATVAYIIGTIEAHLNENKANFKEIKREIYKITESLEEQKQFSMALKLYILRRKEGSN